MDKTCRKCGDSKPTSEFYGNGRGGVRSDCRPCSISAASLWQRENRARATAGHRRRRTGFTESPNGPFCRDHDHACCPYGRMCALCYRGVLCSPCNTALGLLRDDPARLSALAAYVEVRRAVRVH